MNPSVKSAAINLVDAIEQNNQSPSPNIWFVKYCWWVLYHTLNEEFEKASSKQEKEALIEDLKACDRDVQEAANYVVSSRGLTKEEVPDLDPDDPSIPPHIKEVSQILQNEMDKFAKNVRAFRSKKKSSALSKKAKRSKWIES